jgi:hypothetical protein
MGKSAAVPDVFRNVRLFILLKLRPAHWMVDGRGDSPNGHRQAFAQIRYSFK